MQTTDAGAATSQSAGLARNSLLNLIGLGAPLLIAVFAIPPLVADLGTERFGLLGMIWVAISYLNLLDLGLGRATTRFAAASLRAGDYGAVRGILKVAALLQLLLGVVGGVLVALGVPYFVRHFLQLDPALEGDAIAAFVVVALSAPVLTVASSFRGVLEAAQRFGVVNAVRLPVSAANFLVPLAGAKLGWSLTAMVIGMVAVRVLALAAYAIACLPVRSHPSARSAISRERVAELLRFGGWVTATGVLGSLLVYVDRLAVGGIASVDAAGFYTVPHEMVTRLEILPASLVLTLFPALAALHGHATSDESARELFDSSILFIVGCVGPVALVLGIAAHDLLSVWLDPAFADRAAPALRIMSAGMLATAIAYVPHAGIQAAGRPDLTARFHLIELPIHIALLWVLTSRWGIVGAATAWTLRAMYDAVLMYGGARRLGLGGGHGMRRLPLVLGGLAVFAALAGAATLLPARPAVTVGLVPPLLAAWLVWAWYGVLSQPEKARLLQSVRARRAI